MPRRELDALGWNKVGIRVVLRGRGAMHRFKHALVLLRPGHGEHVRMQRGDLFRLGAHAAGHDHFAVFGKRRADGCEQFRLRAIEKAASVNDGEVGIGVAARKLITFGAQPRDNAFGIDQGLRTAERDEGDAGRALHQG